MKIAIGSDHAGFRMKEYIKSVLHSQGFVFQDFGTYDENSADYPDIASPLAKSVESAVYPFGILICGSGNGMAITANKYSGIRAALCWNEEISSLARKHNDANIICLPARFIPFEEGADICRIFLSTGFEGGRHQARIDKISKINSGNG